MLPRPYRVTGWIRQVPSELDYSIYHPKVSKFFKNLAKVEDLPDKVDLTELYPNDFPEVDDQLDLGSCTSNAGKFIVDFLDHRTHGEFLNGSRLFLYYNSRDAQSKDQDAGATIRDTLAALGTYGIVPESWWPYDVTKFANKPSNEDYDEAKNYKATNYVLIDQQGLTPDQIRTGMMGQLHLGLPMEFGTAVYKQIMKVGPDGRVAAPEPGEPNVGGHAIAAVGYDKNFVNLDGSKGAIKFRNSWGKAWGMAGYAWLPFSYFDNDASDVWVLVSEGWIEPTPAPTPTPDPSQPNLALVIGIGFVVMALVVALLYFKKA